MHFYVFILRALTAGIGWIGMYVGLSYSLGAEIAERIGSAGTKAVIGVVVVVAAGLGMPAGDAGPARTSLTGLYAGNLPG